MNLDDLERLLRNLMLSLGHASEMLRRSDRHQAAPRFLGFFNPR